MGTDYIVSVGPIVIIKNPPVSTTETHRCCNNTHCKNYHRTAYTKFCEECGQPIGDWVEAVVKPLDIDFHELLNESLVPDNYNDQDGETIILVANDYTPKHEEINKQIGFQRFNLKYGEECRVFPTPEEMSGSVKTFEGVFAEELSKLKEIFGAD